MVVNHRIAFFHVGHKGGDGPLVSPGRHGQGNHHSPGIYVSHRQDLSPTGVLNRLPQLGSDGSCNFHGCLHTPIIR